jgi:dTDP-4-dehydrorhamnose reductase
MRIAVLGAQGQLGRDLTPRLTGEVIAVPRADGDLARPDVLRASLVGLKPDVVVNCAAYNFVDKAETEPDAALKVNGDGVRHLADACRELGAYLVHVSTDYVFGLDESRSKPLAETDPPGPVSAYGLSKLAGEYWARMRCPNGLVVRTCGLYGVWGSGGKGGNFVETMLRVAGQGKPLKVVADQRCTPTYTADLAEALAKLIGKRTTGLIHATSGGDCSWHEFAAEIFRQAGVSADLTAISSAEFGAPARRPGYSVLACDRRTEAGVTMRPWKDALAAYLRERANRASK